MPPQPIPSLRRVHALLLAATLVACASRPSGVALDERDYPGTLQPPTRLPVEAVWQQRVTASWQAPGEAPQQRGFDAAVQRRGDTLTVVGLSPTGAVGFAITQAPDGITVENRMQEQLRIPPRFILLDVQRAFFPWFDRPEHTGARAQRRDGEQVSERYRDGRLVERSFARLDGDPAGTITITYEWGRPDWALPTRAVLDNRWFGYRLVVETHAETRLDGGGAAAAEERP